MEISVIASGSNGNSCLVEDKDNSILIDAGKSCKEIEQRLNKIGKSLENLNAVLLTHRHHDHIHSAGIISRKYNVPIYMTKEVYEESNLGCTQEKIFSIHKNFNINGLEIKPIETSHNVSSCGFVINHFGLFTDTGIVTKQIEAVFPKLKAVLLESNHDIDMLINGPYPAYLKQWILSEKGHLSNIQASELIQKKGKDLSLVLLGHLSGNNNTPEIAKSTFDTLVKRKIESCVCSRDDLTGSWKI